MTVPPLVHGGRRQLHTYSRGPFFQRTRSTTSMGITAREPAGRSATVRGRSRSIGVVGHGRLEVVEPIREVTKKEMEAGLFFRDLAGEVGHLEVAVLQPEFERAI
jgi:hypothetical protein